MTITRDECDELVAGIVTGEAEGYKEGLFEAGTEEKYRIERLTGICQKICWVLIEQVRAGNIENCVFEAGFGRGRQIDPIAVDIGDGQTAYIEGKIDRVDYLPGGRVKIIDYKTGNENFSIAEAAAGYRLQLMLYLEAAIDDARTARQHIASRKPAGVFYFKITEPMLELSKQPSEEDELMKEIKKSFKLNGLIADDPQVIQNVAGDFDKYSDIVQIKYNKEGEIVGTSESSLISDEGFAELREQVAGKVKDICTRLATGNIDIHPMKTHSTSACAYCDYKGICRFDTIFEGCSYNIVR